MSGKNNVMNARMLSSFIGGGGWGQYGGDGVGWGQNCGDEDKIFYRVIL